MFHQIMLATDASPNASRAAEVAGDIAAKYEAELTIIHVSSSWISMQDIKERADAGRFPNDVMADIKHLQKVLTQARTTPGHQWDSFVPAPASAGKVVTSEILEEAERIARGQGAKSVITVARWGHPAEEIIKQVPKSKPDLVVMGTRGLSSVRGAVLGSVSQKILYSVSCPCLTVK